MACMRERTFTIARKTAVLLLTLIVLSACPHAEEGRVYAAQAKQQVHTIWWKATLRKNIKAGGMSIKSGTSLVVTQRSHKRGGKSEVTYRKKKFMLPNSWLYFRQDLASVSTRGDYGKSVKESFINHRANAYSRTSWLVWVSLDKQRVNVFRGTKGKWSLAKACRCSTGKASTPTPPGRHTIDFKKMYVDGCKYYTEVCGSGMHRWPGTMNKKIFGNHTASHGCIRLLEGDARWIYQNVPKQTTVLVY